jgi:hypothetical protein
MSAAHWHPRWHSEEGEPEGQSWHCHPRLQGVGGARMPQGLLRHRHRRLEEGGHRQSAAQAESPLHLRPRLWPQPALPSRGLSQAPL